MGRKDLKEEDGWCSWKTGECTTGGFEAVAVREESGGAREETGGLVNGEYVEELDVVDDEGGRSEMEVKWEEL